jgi:hypothetical protein
MNPFFALVSSALASLVVMSEATSLKDIVPTSGAGKTRDLFKSPEVSVDDSVALLVGRHIDTSHINIWATW